MTFKEKLNIMGSMLYPLIKPLLFSLDPETAHNLTISIAKLGPFLGRLSGKIPNPELKLRVGSLDWIFPIGLAAGLDKNAEALPFFSSQGFGSVECGTVTLKPQDGNLRPRMFRYPQDLSLRNAMGFPNHGLLEILPRIKNYHGSPPLGVNLGKNKETSEVDSIEELSLLFNTLIEYGDYFVINVSSPNTPGLRALQEKSYLSELFSELNKNRNSKDLYLKIAPDLSKEKIIELTHLAQEFKLSGLIATNTTIIPERGAGGISGLLLKKKSQEVRRIILNEETDLEVIAVGGISNVNDLFELWKDGGKAAQVYTAYVYQGPDLIKKFHMAIWDFLVKQDMSLSDFFSLSIAQRRHCLKDYGA